MTRDECIKIASNSPVLLKDGKMGMLIRTWDDAAGVQVFGEEDIRRVPYASLTDEGGGALAEVTS